MKKALTIFSMLCFVFAANATLRSGAETWIEKKKVITKTYSVSDRNEVAIKNTFGDIQINNWNRKEVKVEVTIKVNSDNDKLATDLLDQIMVDESIGQTIRFETKIGANGNNSNRVRVRNNNAKFEVDYVVYLPPATPLSIKNSFGNVKVEDRSGSTNLHQSFGDMSVGNLANIEDLRLEYGDFKANSVTVKFIKSSYSDINIKNLSGNVQTSIAYGDARIGLSPGLKSLDISAAYSDIILQIPVSIDGLFDIKSNYGDFSNTSNVKIEDISKHDPYGVNMNKVYRGKIGSGETKIVIKSSYGDVSLKNK